MNKWINVSPKCWFQTPQRFLMKVQTSRESHRWVQQFSSTNYSHHQGFSFFILETRPNKPPAEITLSPTKTNILPYFIDLLQIKIPAALITWGAVSVRIHQFSHSSCGLSFSVFLVWQLLGMHPTSQQGLWCFCCLLEDKSQDNPFIA